MTEIRSIRAYIKHECKTCRYNVENYCIIDKSLNCFDKNKHKFWKKRNPKWLKNVHWDVKRMKVCRSCSRLCQSSNKFDSGFCSRKCKRDYGERSKKWKKWCSKCNIEMELKGHYGSRGYECPHCGQIVWVTMKNEVS